jgi:exopolysaccharide production protein ExoQ
MSPIIASAVFALGIAGLFWLNRDLESQTSKALWIPVMWLLIAASRPVSAWLQMAPPVTSASYLDGSPLDRSFFVILLIAGAIVLLKRGQLVGALLRRNLPILLYFLYSGFSVLWSDFPDVAIRRWIKFLGNLVMVLIVLTDSQPAAAIKRLLAQAAFVLLPVSVLLAKYYPDLGRAFTRGESVYSPWTLMYTGVTDSKNGLGTICLLFGLGALCRTIELFRQKDEPRRLRHFVAQFVLILVTAWLFSKANSMTSLCCFLVAGGLIVATSLRRLARSSMFVNFLVVGALCISALAIFVAPSLLASVGRDPTLTGRTDIWKLVLSMTKSPFFGTGFESFWLGPRLERIWSIYWWHPNEAHNGYIEIFLNLGWFGIALFFIVLATGYRNVIAALRRNPDSGGIRLAYFVGGIMYNFTESAFRIIDPVWLFFLLTAMVVPEVATTPVSDYDNAYDEHPPDIDRIFDIQPPRRRCDTI